MNEKTSPYDEKRLGWTQIDIDHDTIELLSSIGSAPTDRDLFPNCYVSAKYLGAETLCRFNDSIIHTIDKKQRIFGIAPRNREQMFAIDALLDQSIELVVLLGRAGCGKSLLALAAGAEQVFEKNLYDKITIIRPTTSLGHGIGFLPGTIDEKLAPWTTPIIDTLNVVFSTKEQKKGPPRRRPSQKKFIKNDLLSTFIEHGRIEMDAMAFIRGRSINNSYIVVDEAQNMTRHEIKTIVTRAGENSKVIVTGDAEQIDVSGISAETCGLSVLRSAFIEQKISAHIELITGERSRLATLCSRLL